MRPIGCMVSKKARIPAGSPEASNAAWFIGVSMVPGCRELQRMVLYCRAQCTATDLVRSRTPPLLAV